VHLAGRREYIRVIGIDAPEKNECFFEDSSLQLEELIAGNDILLDAKTEENRDKYQRLLRYISIDGEDIGAKMIREGYAVSFPWFPHPRKEHYAQLEEGAQEQNRGLWAACNNK